MEGHHNIVLYDEDIRKLEAIKDYINAGLGSDLTLKYLSKTFGIGKSTLRRNFQYHFGIHISEFIRNKRMNKAMDLLLNHAFSIGQIGQEVGYPERSNFARAFTKYFKHPPSYFLRHGESNNP